MSSFQHILIFLSTFFATSKSFKVHELFDEADSYFVEKRESRQYSHYQKNPHNSAGDLVTVNLFDYLKIYVDCLVHIVNYNGANLLYEDGTDQSYFYSPVVLSRYDIVKVEYEVYKKTNNSNATSSNWPLIHTEKRRKRSYRTRLFPYEKVPKVEDEVEWCKRLQPQLECPDIPYRDLSAKAKWTCEVHVYLHPPPLLQNPMFYSWNMYEEELELLIPKSFRRFWDSALIQKDESDKNLYLVNERPIYEIFVGGDNTPEVDAWIYALKHIENPYASDSNTSSRRELLIASTISSDLAEFALITEVTWRCLTCERCNPNKRIPVGFLDSKTELDTIIRHMESATDHIIWQVLGIGGFIPIYHKSGFTFPKAFKTGRQLRAVIKNHIKKGNFENLRWEIEMRLVTTVLGNNSTYLAFPTSPSSTCGKFLKYSPSVKLFPCGHAENAEVIVHKKVLTFVSCGKPEINSLAFRELISIFDDYIWSAIIFSTVFISKITSIVLYLESKPVKITLKGCWKSIRKNCSRSLLYSWKCLLEQGDPVSNDILKSAHIRRIFISFLIVSMVLSTAYKNDNISRLILPRKPIPFDTFEILVASNFKIYTGATYQGGEKEHGSKHFYQFGQILARFLQSKLTRPEEGHHHHRISRVFRSELYSFMENGGSYHDLFDAKVGIFSVNTTDFSKNHRAAYYMDKVKLHPQWFDKLVFSNVTNFDILKGCKRVALLIPESEAATLYHKMRKGVNRKNVFIGKKPLYSYMHGLRFAHWVTPNVLRRIRMLTASGVTNWWDNFVVKVLPAFKRFRNDVTGVESGNAFVPSSITGNIAVIFIVHVTGQGVTILVFLVEVVMVAMIRFLKRKTRVKFLEKNRQFVWNNRLLKRVKIQNDISK